MFKDYYEILNLSPRASGEDVRAAFKRLALQHHPDRVQATVADPCTSAQPTNQSGPSPPHTTTRQGEAEGSNGYHNNQHHNNRSGTVPALSETALAIPSSSSLPRDFTDIQEAYEVLGDVARRYLYDMNYQELLCTREEQRQEEAARHEARLRAVEDAARRTRERERQKQLQALTTVAAVAQAVTSSPPVSTDGGGGTTSSTGTSAHSHGAAATASPSPVAEVHALEDVETQSSTGGAYSSTAPPPRSRRSHAEGKGRKGVLQRRGRWAGECGSAVGSDAAGTGPMATTRLSSQKALSTTSTFVITNSISLAAEGSCGGGASATAAVVARAAGGRPGSLQDGAAERPVEYYHQRSIERTLRVFFDESRAT